LLIVDVKDISKSWMDTMNPSRMHRIMLIAEIICSYAPESVFIRDNVD